jgi:quinolinate synthase
MTALFEKLKHIQVDNPLCHYTEERCARLEPLIDKINSLKKKKNALILAHSYVHPDIIYGVADHVGDSYGLSEKARDTDCEIILFPAVRFMAETAKILNPTKTVIDPNPNGGCSLADSVTEDHVVKLRQIYPLHTFVCYINTTAAVKAECDVCVTSSNVYKIIENLETDKIVFLPDKLMGQNIVSYLKKKNLSKEVIIYDGTCYVHEEFSTEEISLLKTTYPDLKVLAHPECTQEVISSSDMMGSTSQILNYVKSHKDDKTPFLILTECGITSRLQVEHPELRLVGSCMMCKYMKSNSLESILQALESPTEKQMISIPPQIQKGALSCINNMFKYSR